MQGGGAFHRSFYPLVFFASVIIQGLVIANRFENGTFGGFVKVLGLKREDWLPSCLLWQDVPARKFWRPWSKFHAHFPGIIFNTLSPGIVQFCNPLAGTAAAVSHLDTDEKEASFNFQCSPLPAKLACGPVKVQISFLPLLHSSEDVQLYLNEWQNLKPKTCQKVEEQQAFC